MAFDTQVFLDALTSSEFLRGALLTITLAFAAQITAVVLGFALALARTAPVAPVRAGAGLYVWVFRAIPTLLLLLFIWNALPQLIPALTQDWFTPFVAGYFGLALAEAAFMAEILRSALLSVDPEQRMAAKSLGLTPAQTMRKVVLPQVIRVALPPTGNEFITMLKFTSLTSVISLQELLTVAQKNISATFSYAEYYAAAAIYYLAIVSVMMMIQMRIERRYEWTTRRPSTPGASRLGRLRPRGAR
jgi:His/Glu/Gln/Arg/opine family amino acid ABC transporter permease subunit